MAEIIQFRPRANPKLLTPIVDVAPHANEAVRAELDSIKSDRGFATLHLHDGACSEMNPDVPA